MGNDQLDQFYLFAKKESEFKEAQDGRLLRNLDVLDTYSNVEKFWLAQPFFFDEAQIFWFWDKEKRYYKMVDETHLLNSLDKECAFRGSTIPSKIKYEYLESFKRIGRLRMPQEAPTTYVQFEKTIYDIKTGEIFEATPDYFVCNPIPHKVGDSDETPFLDKMISDMVGVEWLNTIYQIIAYFCYSEMPIHTIVTFHGNGSNGKTQLQNFITRFIGENNSVTSDLNSLTENRFALSDLYKKLLCTLEEADDGLIENSSVLKRVTGGNSLLKFEIKNKPAFSAKFYCKILLATNHLPYPKDQSDAYFRRWQIIKFPNAFSGEAGSIIDKIPLIEYNNLAKKVTRILPDLIKKGTFDRWGTVEDRRKAYMQISNPLPLFLQNYCDLADDYYVKTSEFIAAYSEYNKLCKRQKVSRKAVYSALAEEGLIVEKTNKRTVDGNFENTYFIEGLRLKNDWKFLLASEKTGGNEPKTTNGTFGTLGHTLNPNYAYVNFDINSIPKSQKSQSSFVPLEQNGVKSINIEEWVGEQPDMPQKIRSCLQNAKKGGILAIGELMERTGCVDGDIAKLLRDGVIFEPIAGHVKLL
ncbi:MAG: viral dsDNA helicase [Siphoviridae sp. ctjeG17]|nr:MAG: viral dsDNA helicase [Siphoviridae sp. ctjeG17]